MKFIEYFKIKKTENELEFVNIPLDTDKRLFIDPYIFAIENGAWYRECNNLIVDFFQFLIDTIRDGHLGFALNLMDKLHEPNETHLGLSENEPSGRGIGIDQSKEILKKLQKSKAVKTGLLKHLSECELLIPGISYDKISDITINIIRGKLVEFTEYQCRLLDIPVRKVNSGAYWDSESKVWISRDCHLPIYNGKKIILVPKNVAKTRLITNHQEYYSHYVLAYYQQWHLLAGTSLVKTLKNGKRKVYKKELKKMYPCNKDFLLEFSEKNPDVMERYKYSLKLKSKLIR